MSRIETHAVTVMFFKDSGKFYTECDVSLDIVFDDESQSGIDFYRTRTNLDDAIVTQVPRLASEFDAVSVSEYLGYPYMRRSDAHRVR